MYSSMIVLSTMASLVALVFSAMADVHLTLRERRPASGPATGALLIAGIAFVYGFLAIAGATHREVAWGFLLLPAGIPFYVLARANRATSAPADAAPAPREL
jgi:APA family basic amino acid/polyamine antiporter